MFVSRAVGLAVLVCLAACQSSTTVQISRPKAPSPQAMQQALGGTGYAATATFSAPKVDPNTWNGSPIGTGSYSASSTPPQSGGTQSIAADDASDPTQPVHYLMVGNLSGAPGRFFGIVSLSAFAVGTRLVDNTSTFAGIFDGATGDPVALASSGTVVISAAGATITGTFNGTLEDYAAAPPPPPPPPPACRTNADCASGQVCSSGACVTGTPPPPPPPPPPPACVVDADCALREVCRGGACVPGGPVTPGSCNGQQGTGAYSGSAGATATCSALGNGALSLTGGMAAIAEDENGQLALFVVDPASGADGIVVPLSACPSAAGAVSVSGAQLYSQSSATAGLKLYAIRDAAGTVTFSTVGARHTGTFSLNITGGGTVSGSFDVQ